MKVLRRAVGTLIVFGGFIFAGAMLIGHLIMNGIGLILCAITQG